MNPENLIYFADFRAKLDDENTLVIHAGTNLIYMDNAKVSAVVDKKDAEVTAVPVINRRSMICYRKENVHFSCEYQFMIKVTKNFRKARLNICFGGAYGDVQSSYTVFGKNFRKQLKGIPESIDDIKYDNDTVVITGWCADRFPVNVYAGGIDGCRVKRVFRDDVSDYYQDGELNGDAGFVVEIPKDGKKSVNLVMETEEKKIVRSVRIDSELRDKQYSLWQKIALGVKYCRQRGLSVVLSKAGRALGKKNAADNKDYISWLKLREPDKAMLKRQSGTHFEKEPLFSVVIPVYRPVKEYFEAMLNSVKEQSYSKWELCLADGSGDGFLTEESVKKIFGNDSRVKYKALPENLGISGNTNAALSLASGDYIVLSDHDDIIRPDALFECAAAVNENADVDVIYTDEDKIDSETGERFYPHFKPDFNPYLLRSCNYITHLFVFSKELYEKVGAFDKACDGAQDYDMILRCVEKARNIKHIPKVLYSWRSHSHSTAQNEDNKNYVYDARIKALEGHYKRMNINARVEKGSVTEYYYTTRYLPEGTPFVSVIIPNKDSKDDLEKCLMSIVEKQDYGNYEVIIVENNSEKQETFDYYKELESRYARIKVIYYDGEFNFSRINNFAAGYAHGEYLLLLNNDTKMIRNDCLSQLVSIGTRPDVGAVGAKLLYDDGTLQHAGVIIGLAGVAGHAFAGLDGKDLGYFARDSMIQNYSAVTAACMLVRRSVFDEVGGFEEKLKVDFNDVDFCLKIREKGYLIVYNPFAVLYHYESKSRGKNDTPKKHARYNSEIAYMVRKWAKIYETGDPYYNPNLTLQVADFSLKE